MTSRRKPGARSVRAAKKTSKTEKRDMSVEPTLDVSSFEPTESDDSATIGERMDGRRARRSRPTPSWLLEHQNDDEIAKRRVLMVLRVLSGETPVTDAIEGTDISRQMYYQLEERALKAMLRVLTPGVETTSVTGPDPSMLRRIAELEAKTKQLEQEKRRAERMLFLTRKMVPTGPMKSHRRGRPVKSPGSKVGGPNGSPASTRATNSTSRRGPEEDGTADSTQRRSEVVPHGGTAS